jgi:hypothetical protein
MYHSIYEGKLFNLEEQLNNTSDRKQEIFTLRKKADKGAYTCPHCGTSLIVKAGDVRGVFFSHSLGKACVLTESYYTYQKQTVRESKQHSVMREIVHEVLKNQEKIRPDLRVDFGYIAKAKEKWSHFPDIILRNNEEELAISILTNVDRSKDSKLNKQIKKRNQYFKEKGLQTLWFIEKEELSLDWENHVIHLWESEIDLAIKTPEDKSWDDLVQELSPYPSDIFNVFKYWHKNKNIVSDTRSLYYIYSTQEGIDFSVQRFIMDETQFPYRAFALAKGYRMSISSALSFNEKLALSDSHQELIDRGYFQQEYYRRKKEQEEHVIKQSEINYDDANLQVASTFSPPVNKSSSEMSYVEFTNKLREKLGMTQQQQLKLWHNYVLKRGIKHFDQLWLAAEQLDNFDQFEEALNAYLNGRRK